uniref:Retrotransposon gag domain-containing protein n=1 Tax=Ananas comosus var. bracteatus TaxID=296719 RepID=A0A6V7NYF5_ANACO|nr:unnamed protein product [Ananas comosus var. bracteatus]
MANGTRLRQQTTSYNQSFEEALQSARVVNQKLDVLVEALQQEEARRHEIMMQENARRHEQLLELIRSRFVHAKGKGTVVQVPIEKKHRQQYMPYMELSFPDFNGTDPKGWLRNCEQYFDQYQVPEQQWIGIASMHIEGDARFWKQAYFFNRPRVNWSEFSDAICERFTAAKEGYPIREFSTCEQTNSIESCQKNCEAAKRSEIMVQEDDHIHEAGSAGSEKECDDYLQLETNRKPEIAWSERASKPEELLKLLAAQPPLLKPAHNAPNAYTTSAETGNTIKAVANTTHNSEESLNLNLVEGAAPSEQTKMQGLCDEYGEEYITGKQCKNSSLHMLTAQKKAEMGVESETAKEEERSYKNLIDFGIAKVTQVESTTFATLRTIADCDHKMLNKSYYPQFAKNKREHQFLADSRKLGLKDSDAVLGVYWMKEFRQVPFDPGPNKVTIHSIEKASHMPNITNEMPMVIKHRAQLLAAQPYMIKAGATMEEMHSCIQKLHREIEDEGNKPATPHGCNRSSILGTSTVLSPENRPLAYLSPIRNQIHYVQSTYENEFIAILWEESNLYHAKSFPKMEFLWLDGNNTWKWISSYENYCKLHQISNQQKVEIATMLRQQMRPQDLRVQMLSPILSLAEVCYVWDYVNEYKKLGTVLKMPHPCSRFLAYEQDKLQESDELIAYLNNGLNQKHQGRSIYKIETIAIMLVVATWEQNLRGKLGSNNAHYGLSPARWWKKEQVIHFFEEPPNKQQQRKEYNADKRRSKGVFEVKEQLCLKLLLCEQPIMPLEGYLRLTINQFGLYYISEQTRSAARRLQLPDGPKGEPRPNRSAFHAANRRC